jgi:hypothetical protein
MIMFLRDDFFSMMILLLVSGDGEVSSFLNHDDQNPGLCSYCIYTLFVGDSGKSLFSSFLLQPNHLVGSSS